MAFDSFTQDPVDLSQIELTEDHELRLWARYYLACTPQELVDAIDAVGANTFGGEHLY